MSRFVEACRTDELSEGQAVCVERDGKRIAVFKVNGAYYAIDDTCTHSGGPLSEGVASGATVTCPWHGAEFDLKTGRSLGPPADEDVSSYKTKVEGDHVWVEI